MVSRPRYEYRCRFLIDQENTTPVTPEEDDSFIFLLFTFQTNFILKIMKRRPTRVGQDDDDDATIKIGSETRQVSMWVRRDLFLDTKTQERRNTASLLEEHTSQRFREYSIIPEDAIPKLADEAVGFAGRTVADPRYRSLLLVPVVAAVDVCTVQQEGEPLDAAMERAIRVGRLGPSEWCPDEGGEVCEELWCFLKNELPRTGVEVVDLCSDLMEDRCSICLHGPANGTQVSRLPSCGHAFHYHCVVSWLVRKNTCPLCCRQVHDLISSDSGSDSSSDSNSDSASSSELDSGLGTNSSPTSG
ncbi:hypothetical protein OROMI_029615 [Orobanche minor]